jgi:polyisoprenoid-binding protein YceI
MLQKTTWAIDPTHTEIGFKVKHMMFTNVSGKISGYTATIATDGDEFGNAAIDFTAAVNSITTGSADRDAHLLSADFFDVAQFSTIHFVASSFTKVDNSDFELTGNLTIHGVTKPVKLAAGFGGLMKDPWGNIKAGFSISGKISRKDFGLTWNAALETGGVLVSDEVRIIAEVQLIKQ